MADFASHPGLAARIGLSGGKASGQTRDQVLRYTSSMKCSGGLCGKVYGTGLRVTKVFTRHTGNVGCTHAHYVIVEGPDLHHGKVLRTATGSQVCSVIPGGGFYYYNFDNQVPDRLPYTCPKTSTLGVFWDSLPGEVTFSIHP